MIEIAMQMLFCLFIAALLGGIIGYLLGRIRKCDRYETNTQKPLYDYDELQQQEHTPHKEVFAPIPDAVIKQNEKGIKPISLTTPRNGIEDDLKEITGIGLKVENTLFELGIFHFAQIADWTEDNVIWIDHYLGYEGRVKREEWIEQAKHLARDAHH